MSTVHPLTIIARDLTTKYYGNSLAVGGYFLYSPQGRANEGQGRPIKVTNGQFLDSTYGLLSNYWTWHYVQPDGSLGKHEASGYGGDESYFKPITRRQAIKLARRNAA